MCHDICVAGIYRVIPPPLSSTVATAGAVALFSKKNRALEELIIFFASIAQKYIPVPSDALVVQTQSQVPNPTRHAPRSLFSREDFY